MANETLLTLEDTALDALKTLDITERGGYLRTRKAYQGELDVEAADQILLQFPALLLFIDGMTFTPASTRGLEYIERPQLTVFVGDVNWRGERDTRRGGVAPHEIGTYQMIRDALDTLAGKTFGLPIGPLVPKDVRSVVQSATPPMSVYAVRFEVSDVEFNATGD